jgi:hypothetical protein
VDRAHDDLELRQDFVGIVERSVLEDVHLGTCEDANAQASRVDLMELLDVGYHALLVQAVGDGDRF